MPDILPDMDALLSPPLEPLAVRSRRPWTAYALYALIWLIIVLVFWISLVEGLRLRRWVFDITDPIRFTNDTAAARTGAWSPPDPKVT